MSAVDVAPQTPGVTVGRMRKWLALIRIIARARQNARVHVSVASAVIVADVVVYLNGVQRSRLTWQHSRCFGSDG